MLSPDAPNNQQPSANWLSTSAAAVTLGVSERAVQKWCSVGKLSARRVPGRRGEKWEIEAASVENQGRTRPNAEGEQAERDGEQPEQKTANKPNHAQNKPEREAEQAEPFVLHQLRADIERERQERQRDQEQIVFLRGIIEQRDRDAAELRAALRKALDNAPRALTSGVEKSAPSAPESPTNNDGEQTLVVVKSGPQIAPESGEISSYDALADWLESEMNL